MYRWYSSSLLPKMMERLEAVPGCRQHSVNAYSGTFEEFFAAINNKTSDIGKTDFLILLSYDNVESE